MCTFVSLTINADADPSAVQATLDRFGFRLVEIPIPIEFPVGRRHLARNSGCDCGSTIGTAVRREAPYAPSDLVKFRKQGWSQAKIARWAEQKLAAEAKSERAEEDRPKALHRDLAAWTEFVRALIDTPTVRVVGLMHGNYSSGPSCDLLPVAVEAPRPVADLTEETLFCLPEGTLNEWF